MAKKLLNLDNFDGGLNNDADPKDINANEYAEFTNLSNLKFGQLKALGGFSFIDDISWLTDGINSFNHPIILVQPLLQLQEHLFLEEVYIILFYHIH